MQSRELAELLAKGIQAVATNQIGNGVGHGIAAERHQAFKWQDQRLSYGAIMIT